jgi:hypothetical protein
MEMIGLDTLGKLHRHRHGFFGWSSDCGSPSRYWDDVRVRRVPKPAMFDIDVAALIRERGKDCLVVGLGRVQLVAVILASLIAAPPATAAEGEFPSWMVPSPGTAALINEFSKDFTTFCDTADHYRAWLHYEPAEGCGDLQIGQPVVIEGLVYDPAKDAVPFERAMLGIPLARIGGSSKGVTGYLDLRVLAPVIPKGTTIQLTSRAPKAIRLASSQNANLDEGLDLGNHATMQVIRFLPSTMRDLYIEVTSGPHKGRTGWVFSLDANQIDGISTSTAGIRFRFSVLRQNQSIPSNLLSQGD